MIKNHVDAVSVSAEAGHKYVTTTLSIYAEESEEANAASAETISSCIQFLYKKQQRSNEKGHCTRLCNILFVDSEKSLCYDKIYSDE